MTIETPEGPFAAGFSDRGLCSLAFPGHQPRPIPSTCPVGLPERIRGWATTTARALKAALAGKHPRAWPPLDLSAGTGFQQEVWQALRRIPCGQTRTYGEIAAAIGRPRAVRAAGQACGANPVPVLVPCHRVLGAHGRLGGFSGGLQWKRLLLEREVR